MARTFGAKSKFKNAQELENWLFSLTPKIRNYYERILSGERPKEITELKWFEFQHSVCRDLMGKMLSPKMMLGKDEIKPVPIHIFYGKSSVKKQNPPVHPPSLPKKGPGKPKKMGSDADRNPGR